MIDESDLSYDIILLSLFELTACLLSMLEKSLELLFEKYGKDAIAITAPRSMRRA